MFLYNAYYLVITLLMFYLFIKYPPDKSGIGRSVYPIQGELHPTAIRLKTSFNLYKIKDIFCISV